VDDVGDWTEEHLLALTLIRSEVVSCVEQLSEALEIDLCIAQTLLDNLEEAGFIRRITVSGSPQTIFRRV
jgi:predicted transcriptional regulator